MAGREAPGARGTLRVVFPCTEIAHPLAVAALHRHAPQAEIVDLGVEHDAYYRLLSDLWQAGESFLVVEHDIEIHGSVLPQVAVCGGDWCVFPYYGAGTSLLEHSLGCTRFAAPLLARQPDLMAKLPVRDWRRLDCEMFPALLTAGERRCVHRPMVDHHHIYPGRPCSCGKEH